MNRVRQLSNAAKLNMTGLVLAAAGMLLQIAAWRAERGYPPLG